MVYNYRKRLDLMRKMYDQASDVLSDTFANAKMNTDQFCDKIPWLKLIGRYVLYLVFSKVYVKYSLHYFTHNCTDN